MKKLTIVLTLFTAFFFNAYSNDIEKKVSSKIDHVTVFMQGAQITRSGSTTIPKGTSVLIFENVSRFTNQQSIKASGKGNFTITDVQFRYVYPDPILEDTEEKDRIQKQMEIVRDSMERVNLRLSKVREKKDAVSSEKNLLLGHPLLRGQGKPDSLDLLIGTMEYIETKLQSLADRMYQLQVKESETRKEYNQLTKRLQELQNFLNNQPRPSSGKPVYQILVAVSSRAQTTGTVEINYNVTNAGWSPWYDITAKDAGDDIELIYKAAVYQNTGEDWKNVKLRISNANPNQSNIKPVLPRWYIDYFRQIQVEGNANALRKKPAYFENSVRKDEEESKMVLADSDDEVEADMAYDYSQKIQNFSSVEFNIDLPYYITSNGKSHFVTVEKHNLKAQFKHYLVPKLDKDAFVMARITDWENLDLLVGSANIYFGNTFIGRTVIDPTIVTDTLEVSMGRYRSMAVKRTKVKSDTKKQLVGGKEVYTGTFKIELRNNSANDIDLVLEDQIPLTTNQDIEILLTTPDGGVLQETTGLITWHLKLKPYEKKTIEFTFEIKYPKDQKISGL